MKVSDSEAERMSFVQSVIADHKASEQYKTAIEAEQYYAFRNVTITKFQKWLTTQTGNKIPDIWSANFKIPSRFYFRFVTDAVQFLLGNGAYFNNKDTKDKLGNKRYSLDTQLQECGRKAFNGGVGWGFWNYDHIDVFGVEDFAPLYDEEDGSVKAGVRFWQIAENKPLRAVLYEIDGYTSYIWNNDPKLTLGDEWRKIDNQRAYKEKEKYIITTKSTEEGGIENYEGYNYDKFPIVPLYGNPARQSELVGLRQGIDCFDLIKSGYANDIDDASLIYWTVTNAGGMDNVDFAEFLQKLKMLHGANIDDDVNLQSHSVDIPYAGREAILTRLENDLYKDAMAFNSEAVARGNTTATAIKASYKPLDIKTDLFEYGVLSFLDGIMELAGIDDEATFKRGYTINQLEETQMVLSAANYLDDETILKKLPFISPDEVESILNKKTEEEAERYEVDYGQSEEENGQKIGFSGENDSAEVPQ